MDKLGEIKSPFLCKVIERRGINDDQASQAYSLWNAISGSRSPLTQSLR